LQQHAGGPCWSSRSVVLMFFLLLSSLSDHLDRNGNRRSSMSTGSGR
jgi:hypothetical protein